MTYQSVFPYFLNNIFGQSGNSDSCWAVDSTYVANTPLLFQYDFGDNCDTFTPSSFDQSSFWNWNSFDFSWNNFSNWDLFSNISLPWTKNKDSDSGSSSNSGFVGSQSGLLSTTEWDKYMRGRIKTVKRCNEDYISELQPKMQEKVRKLEAFAKSKGITFTISSGYRTPEKQQSLINKYGRRRAASVDGSPHRRGCAIDINTNGILTEAQCKMLGEYAESIGMRWGGRWGGPGSSTERERWHFDIQA